MWESNILGEVRKVVLLWIYMMFPWLHSLRTHPNESGSLQEAELILGHSNEDILNQGPITRVQA